MGKYIMYWLLRCSREDIMKESGWVLSKGDTFRLRDVALRRELSDDVADTVDEATIAPSCGSPFFSS